MKPCISMVLVLQDVGCLINIDTNGTEISAIILALLLLLIVAILLVTMDRMKIIIWCGMVLAHMVAIPLFITWVKQMADIIVISIVSRSLNMNTTTKLAKKNVISLISRETSPKQML